MSLLPTKRERYFPTMPLPLRAFQWTPSARRTGGPTLNSAERNAVLASGWKAGQWLGGYERL